MNINIIEKKLPSTDQCHTLYGKVYVPEGEAKGIIHVVHGMTEYIDRYEPFMTTMAQNGFIAAGFDNLGHGHTVNDTSELGFIAHKDGWKMLVDDTAIFALSLKEQFSSSLPYILLGHSMGSFIVRLAAADYNFQDKLIIIGTSGPDNAASTGLSVVRTVKSLRGEKYVSKSISKLIFGPYNKKFGKDDPYNWLSVDEEVHTKYAADPLCNYTFTISGMEDLLTLVIECNKDECLMKTDTKKPILILSGSDDPVGHYGKGVLKFYKKLKDYGADAKLKLYKGYRHELLNDFCKDKVTDDILKFITT